MNWLQSLGLGLISGVLGLFCGGAIGDACTRWFRVSNFEGGAAIYVVGWALLSGIVGLILGFAIGFSSLSAQPNGGFLRALGLCSGTIVGLAAIVALICYGLGDVPPKLDGRRLLLQVEFRLPAGAAKPDDPEHKGSWASLGVGTSGSLHRPVHAHIDFAQLRQEEGRWIVPAELPIYTTSGPRFVRLEIAQKELATLALPLPGRPGREFFNWSDWLPKPDTGMSHRFRIALVPLPPPPVSAEEAAARNAAQEEEALQAIPNDAPLSAYFPYTRYGADEGRRAKAVARITARTNHPAELSVLMVDENAETAAEALYLVQHLPDPSEAITAGVAAAGRNLAERLRAVNALTPEQDPSYEAAATISIRFSAWMSATRSLRERKRGDFVAELKPILELSRVRTDSYVLQQDVRRVASFYLKEWAGIAPLPGDPPPK